MFFRTNIKIYLNKLLYFIKNYYICKLEKTQNKNKYIQNRVAQRILHNIV